jgi:hypothetical protein
MNKLTMLAILLLAACGTTTAERAQLTLDALRAAIAPAQQLAKAGCDAAEALTGDAGDPVAGLRASESCATTQAVLDDVAALERGATKLLALGHPDDARLLVRRAFELLGALGR